MKRWVLAASILLSGCTNPWWTLGDTKADPTGDAEVITIYITGGRVTQD